MELPLEPPHGPGVFQEYFYASVLILLKKTEEKIKVTKFGLIKRNADSHDGN